MAKHDHEAWLKECAESNDPEHRARAALYWEAKRHVKAVKAQQSLEEAKSITSLIKAAARLAEAAPDFAEEAAA